MLIFVLSLHKEHRNGGHVLLHRRCNCSAPWEAAHDWPLCQACGMRSFRVGTTALSASEAPEWRLGTVLSYGHRLTLTFLLQACCIRIDNEEYCKRMSAIKNRVVMFRHCFWIKA
jgi:hypothetical protein